MTIVLPRLFHWAPVEARAGIVRCGLKPRTPTAVGYRPIPNDPLRGHIVEDVEPDSVLAVCLGTSPRTAWNYSAAFGELGSEWDLWEVRLEETDEIHFRPFIGYWAEEIRVANPIPKSRVWWGGTRTRAKRRVDSNPPDA